MTEPWRQWEGQVIDGQFQLRRYLGCGQRSAVFLTQSGGTSQQRAALKLIAADPREADAQLSRWEQASALSQRRLVRIHAWGRYQQGGLPFLYIVTEYGDENLAEVLASRPLSESEARDMVQAVVEGLAYLHQKGFVHGHIKPSNILAVNEQLKIAADGLSCLGESIFGREEKASPADDIWSLGMTLTQALTQHLPERGPVQTDPLPPPNLPAPFLDIVRGCLRADSRHRITLVEINAKLHPTSPKHRYLAPAAAIAGVALAGIVAVPRLSHRAATYRVTAPPAVQTQPPQPQPELAKKPLDHSADRVAAAGHQQVVHRSLPDVPQKARDTIDGTVRVVVRAHVNEAGRVASASLDSPGPSKYFAGLSLQATRRWRFDAWNEASDWLLRFEYTKSETKIIPVRLNPNRP